jgi:hypothetical protein
MGWFDDVGGAMAGAVRPAAGAISGWQPGPGQRVIEQAGRQPTGVVTGDKTGGYYQGPMPQFDAQLFGSGNGQPTSHTYAGESRTQQFIDANGNGVDDRDDGSLGQGGPRQQQGGGQYQPYSDAAFQAVLHRYLPTNDGVRQAYAEAQRTFGPENVPELLEHPERLDKFRFRDGRTIDAVVGAGGSNPSWGWMQEGHGGGGGGGAIGAAGAMMGGNWQAGMDPSYEFRFKEGQKALERSAASKGTLLTGGTLKALAGYGQGMASTEFGNIFGRNMQLAGMGLNAAQTGAASGSSYAGQAGSLGSNYAANQGNLITGQGNANAAGQIGSSNAWGETIGNVANQVGQMPWFNRRQQRRPMDERIDGTV